MWLWVHPGCLHGCPALYLPPTCTVFQPLPPHQPPSRRAMQLPLSYACRNNNSINHALSSPPLTPHAPRLPSPPALRYNLNDAAATIWQLAHSIRHAVGGTSGALYDVMATAAARTLKVCVCMHEGAWGGHVVSCRGQIGSQGVRQRGASGVRSVCLMLLIRHQMGGRGENRCWRLVLLGFMVLAPLVELWC